MDIAIFLLMAGAVVVFISIRAKPSRSRKRPEASLQQPADSLPEPRAPVPFDVATAQPVSGARVLVGRAWIVDGDTITIDKTQIRLFGVDAPEMNHPHGRNAKWALQRLCKGHEIRAEITDVDGHGRTVARCTLPDGRDLSAEMVSLGLAIDWAKFSGGAYRHLETPDARRKLWLADARQKGRMHVWERFEARQTTVGRPDGD